ncbi:hypothetical protein CAPTEDRAFT_192191 [Capitella teleta]|uniref:LRRCT domain-containing protein n=1 Tax=Capitella teleta TaxID=283909 RepID=R7TM59_CAPTE|nr:hypothetical protein CAPTEDRAFT_192191 [Capitella teleta]|eukprot:ELT94913.1 hypothetical protein CAPTEDRAFT_192191 [Capitella teleta]
MAKTNARFQEKNDFNVESMSFYINEIETYKDKFRYKQTSLRATRLRPWNQGSTYKGESYTVHLLVASMELYRMLWLFVFLTNFEEKLCELVNRQYNGLTFVPGDISPNVTELWLQGNAFTTIRQSDFNDKFTQLAQLKIRLNNISSIESGCFKGTVLQELYIDTNKLTSIPDLHEVSTTMEKLGLQFNQITKISMEDLSYLTKLKWLSLLNNLISTLPDFTQFMPALTELNLEENPLDCCQSTAWLKQVPSSVLNISQFPCKYPSKWNSTDWNATTSDMIWGQPCHGWAPEDRLNEWISLDG